MMPNIGAAGRLAENCHLVRIATKVLNVVLNPFESRDLIPKSDIIIGHRSVSTSLTDCQEAEGAESVINCHDNCVTWRTRQLHRKSRRTRFQLYCFLRGSRPSTDEGLHPGHRIVATRS